MTTQNITDFELSSEDLAIVQSLTARVSDGSKQQIIGIHETHLARNRKRLTQLDAERRSLLRAIAMREEAVRRLEGRSA